MLRRQGVSGGERSSLLERPEKLPSGGAKIKPAFRLFTPFFTPSLSSPPQAWPEISRFYKRLLGRVFCTRLAAMLAEYSSLPRSNLTSRCGDDRHS